MGGQNVSCDFGGGGMYHRARPKNQFWRPQKVGFAWPVPGSSKQQGKNKRGGGKRIIGGGGPKPFLGRGFMVCFPLPWVFHPLCLSLKSRSKISISTSRFPHKKKGLRWVARSKISISLKIFNLARNLDFFDLWALWVNCQKCPFVHNSVCSQFLEKQPLWFVASIVWIEVRKPSSFGVTNEHGPDSQVFFLRSQTLKGKWTTSICNSGNVGPAPLQKVVGDFCCISFGGFCRGFSWRIFLGTFSHKNEEQKSWRIFLGTFSHKNEEQKSWRIFRRQNPRKNPAAQN